MPWRPGSLTLFSNRGFDLASRQLSTRTLNPVFQAWTSGSGYDVAVPKEGTLAWFDLMAIPKDAPHPEAAYQFINYLLKRQSGAGIANYAFFAVPNLAADAYLLDEVKNDPSLYPPEAIKQKLFTQTAHSAKYLDKHRYDRLLSRAWSNLKTNR